MPVVRIGITLGDPSGIGPEIVARAVHGASDALRRRLVLFADAEVVQRGFATVGAALPTDLQVRDAGAVAPGQALPGRPDTAGARAQVIYLEQAMVAARAREIGALVTAPIHKHQAASAGFGFAGHTEFLADRLGAPQVAMMFAGPRFRVVLVTVHEALAAVPRLVTRERVVSITELAVRALRDDFGVSAPRVGVLALNPHAGEARQFGNEEHTVIAPAVAELRQRFDGQASFFGPLPPDSAYRTPYDLYVAMYHDQALIATKLIEFERSVNVTLGLPIVRTSPDHGVAYDIAGRGIADATPFVAALELAEELLKHRAARGTR